MLIKQNYLTISKSNLIFKFADDTNLLSPEYTDIDICVEFRNIIDWVDINKMKLNLSKTKKIVFRRPRYKVGLLPPLLPPLISFILILVLLKPSYWVSFFY